MADEHSPIGRDPIKNQGPIKNQLFGFLSVELSSQGVESHAISCT